MTVLSIILALLLVTGSLLGLTGSLRIKRLEKDLAAVRRDLQQVLARLDDPAGVKPVDEPPLQDVRDMDAPTELESAPTTEAGEGEPSGDDVALAEPGADAQGKLALLIRRYWMVGLGALCVSLAGIFLVRYSIEQGLLGPTARVLLALAAGVTLHGAALWLRRRTGEAHPAFAALSGAASIIVFAALLAALHLYDLLSPGVAFTLLAVTALATMGLSLRHGPVLAIIGLLGAYGVPILVNTGSNNTAGALLYALIISAAALLLLRWVYRPWLWAGICAGALGWWLLSLAAGNAALANPLYLASLTLAMLMLPGGNYRLHGEAEPGRIPDRILFGTLCVMTIAMGATIVAEALDSGDLLLWLPMVAVLLLASGMRPILQLLPWLTLGIQLVAWLAASLLHNAQGWQPPQLQPPVAQEFASYAAVMAVLYSLLSSWVGRGAGFSHWRASLIVLAPLAWLALGYLLLGELSADWRWALAGLATGLVYALLARRLLLEGAESFLPWLILASHFSYSLAAAMLLREATLTLALAAQLVTLAWLLRRFSLAPLEWLMKLVMAVVLLRLTLNPWLLSYPIDVHWSLWTYGGATAFAAIAGYVLRGHARLGPWLAVATAQLLVLFLAAETRYWLYDGDIFRAEYSLTESAINTSLWGMLGLLYYRRSLVSQHLQRVYTWASTLLLLGAAYNYLLSLTILNPLWAGSELSSTPLWNLVTGAYGAPVPVLLLLYRYYREAWRQRCLALAGAAFFIFVSLQIRHLWQGGLDLGQPASDGELYTYSVVWMVMALAAMLYNLRRPDVTLYRAGMVLLLLVVAKLFMVDMAGLTGLWRVASFLGLGLSLLGLGYLHGFLQQRLADSPPK